VKRRLVVVVLAAVALVALVPAVRAQLTDTARHVQYTLTATATPLSDSTILDSSQTARKITVKNATGAANALYIGDSNVTNAPANAGVELEAGRSYTWNYLSPSQLWIVGTVNAANIAFIEAEY